MQLNYMVIRNSITKNYYQDNASCIHCEFKIRHSLPQELFTESKLFGQVTLEKPL